MNDQRLIDLETKFSFQDTTIEELRKTVHAQYLAIEKLEKTLKLLSSRLGGLEDSDIRRAHEKPPHY